VNVEDGTGIINIYKEYMSKTCILDDFKFYETRQKIIRDKKIKQKKQAGTHTSEQIQVQRKFCREYVVKSSSLYHGDTFNDINIILLINDNLFFFNHCPLKTDYFDWTNQEKSLDQARLSSCRKFVSSFRGFHQKALYKMES
ncbi:hypothetical protein HID58_051882, partial [Brassica napus]